MQKSIFADMLRIIQQWMDGILTSGKRIPANTDDAQHPPTSEGNSPWFHLRRLVICHKKRCRLFHGKEGDAKSGLYGFDPLIEIQEMTSRYSLTECKINGSKTAWLVRTIKKIISYCQGLLHHPED